MVDIGKLKTIKRYLTPGLVEQWGSRPWSDSEIAKSFVDLIEFSKSLKCSKGEAIEILISRFGKLIDDQLEPYQAVIELRLIGHWHRISKNKSPRVSEILEQILLGSEGAAMLIDMSGEKDALQLVLSYLSEKYSTPLCILDVGANIGKWSEVVLEFSKSNLDLHIFEPNKNLITVLQENINKKLQQNKFENSLYINNYGLSMQNSNQKLYINKQSHEQATISQLVSDKLYSNNTEMMNVKMEKGINYCISQKISNIHYLKIDTEGLELDVLRSFLLFSNKPSINFIQFEYGLANYFCDSGLLDFFEELSDTYLIAQILPEGIKPLPEYTQSLENFKWGNFLAINYSEEDFLSDFYEV